MSQPNRFTNLGARLATALVALPLVGLLLLRGPAWAGVLFGAAVLVLAQIELLALVRARGVPASAALSFAALALAFLDIVRPFAGQPTLWPLGALVILLFALGGADHQAGLAKVGVALCGAAYLGGLGGAMTALLLLEPATGRGGWLVVLLLSILMVGDTFAYFGGHLAGRHKLAPTLSPGKTVEGALFGLLGGVLAAVVIRQVGVPQLPLTHAVGLGLVVMAAGIAGDLFESRLKRWAGVKDSGTVFPGHGGMLDRLDSLLFGAPVLYAYFALVR